MDRRSLLVALTLLALPPLTASAEEVWQTIPAPPPMPKAHQSGYAPVNGIEIWYATYGDPSKPAVVLLHGGLANSNYWGNQVPAFDKDFYVITMDSRGHGRSTRNDQPYSYGLMASDVLALLDYLKIQRASIVGWSDGGIIGLDLAIHHPDRLNKVFALAANYIPSGVREDIGQSVVFNRFIEEAGEQYKQLSKTPDQYQAFVDQISKMWATEPNYTKEQLESIRVPMAIAQGEHDEAIKTSHTEEMAKLIPGSKLYILPGVSHFAILQNPKLMNQTILDFLKS
ncbi:MAG: alpha/beta hydrolase [Geminicoccaceae bacterium]